MEICGKVAIYQHLWELQDCDMYGGIAGFDLVSNFIYNYSQDHTLIRPKNGRKFRKDPNDWEFTNPYLPQMLKRLSTTHRVVIFSNQAGVKSAKELEDFHLFLRNFCSKV